MEKTIIYLIRHAEKSKILRYEQDSNEFTNDRARIISIAGIKQAEQVAKLQCLADVDAIYSSEYSRSILTALFLAENRGRLIQIKKEFNERQRRGNSNIMLPENFRIKQMLDEDYKVDGGECRKEVCLRFNKGIDNILTQNRGEKIAVFTHKTAMTMFLMSCCEYCVLDDVHLFFNGKEVFTGKWNGSPEIMKLEFENMTLNNVERVDNHC